MSIDFIAGRVHHGTALPMPRKHELRRKEGKTEFADVQYGKVGVFHWIRAEIPCFYFMSSYLEAIEVLHASNLRDGLGH